MGVAEQVVGVHADARSLPAPQYTTPPRLVTLFLEYTTRQVPTHHHHVIAKRIKTFIIIPQLVVVLVE